MIDPSLAPALAPTGRLRACLNLANTVLAHSHTVSAKPAGVTIDLSRELARRLGVPLDLLPWQAPGDSLRAMAEGAADVGYLAVDPQRAEQVHFTAPYVQIEACYLAHEACPLRHADEVDQPGIKVLVMATSAYDLHLTRSLRHARLVRLPASQVLPALLQDRCGRRVAAGIRQALLDDQRRAPGLRLLDGHFLAIGQAMVLPLGSGPEARGAVAGFLAEMARSGFIAESLVRHGIAGATVLQP